MYNLLSDKLDRFEREIRKVRNQVFGRMASATLISARWILSKSRAYVHTELLRSFRETLAKMHGEVEIELELRKKISSSGIEQIIRDSTVLTSE